MIETDAIDRLIDWLVDWNWYDAIDWLVDWNRYDWLIDWLLVCLIDWLIENAWFVEWYLIVRRPNIMSNILSFNDRWKEEKSKSS